MRCATDYKYHKHTSVNKALRVVNVIWGESALVNCVAPPGATGRKLHRHRVHKLLPHCAAAAASLSHCHGTDDDCS